MTRINTDQSLRRIQLSGYASLFAVVGATYWWASTAELSGAVIAPATVVSDTFAKRIQHREGGIIAEIKVRNGDRVVEGQDLVVLDDTDSKAELSVVGTGLDELLIKKLRLDAQRDGKSKFVLPAELAARVDDAKLATVVEGQASLLRSLQLGVKQRRDQLQAQIEQLQQQITGLKSQRDARAKQLRLAQSDLDDQLSLKKQGLTTNSRLSGAEQALVQIQGELGQVDASMTASKTRIGEVKLQILQVEEDARSQALTELRDTEARIAEFEQRQVSAKGKQDRITIKAPITGTVLDIAVNTVGGVVGPGEVLMRIEPEGEDLVLQAQIAPQDVDQVTVGQIARVRFPSFSGKDTPEINAEVSLVDATTTQTNPNLPPFYSVRLLLKPSEIARLGDNKLRSGMNAEAYIQTENRSALSYLLKPLKDMLPKMMRES
jgi:HlyD family secretion protein